MTDHATHSPAQLWELVKDIRFAMFTTRNATHGHLHSRPMTTQNSRIDEDNLLWFFMSRASEPVADFLRDPEVNIAYADPHEDSYVSVSGEAAVVDDRAKKHQLWNKQVEAWFPNGPDDPDVALVCVRISHAEYWDVKENKLTQILKMATSAVTGRPPRMGEHGHVRMN